MKVKTFTRETLNGHQAGFTIGVQTFYLQEQLSEEEWTSLEHAKWFEKMLKKAFNNINVLENGNEGKET